MSANQAVAPVATMCRVFCVSERGYDAWRTRRLARHRVRRTPCCYVKYEDVYVRAYETVSAVRSGLQRDFTFSTAWRPHTALAGRLRRLWLLAPVYVTKPLGLS